MDSFYDNPRQPPVKTAINEIHSKPTVPEVSVIDSHASSFQRFKTNLSLPSQKNKMGFPAPSTYPKLGQQTQIDDMSRKQVRFQNPTNRKFDVSPPMKPPLLNIKENISPNFQRPNLDGKTFKQIYMANVPNRHLDLSILDAGMEHNSPSKSDSGGATNHLESMEDRYGLDKDRQPLTFANPLAVKQPIDSHGSEFALRALEPKSWSTFKTNFSNSTRADPKPVSTNKINVISDIQLAGPSRTECLNSPTKNVSIAKYKKPEEESTNEPTIKDLFQIIQAQNQQIARLQEQVSSLKTSIQPQIEQNAFNRPEEEPMARPQFMQQPKFSIDLKATSFEVSFRPQANKFRKVNDFQEARIQEIHESEHLPASGGNELSLKLNESVNVGDGSDSYVSNVPSIQINMEQYESSDEDEEESDDNSFNIGQTFYKDLIDQVNNALRNMKMQSNSQLNKKSKNEMKEQTINAVKQATQQHLRSIGVNLPPIEESSEVGSEAGRSEQSEISFAVKQLLMKYLPDDYLTQAMTKDKPKMLRKLAQNNDRQKMMPTQEFSFATMQYLKKYNILNGKSQPAHPKSKTKSTEQKMLDVTALKLQPKLL